MTYAKAPITLWLAIAVRTLGPGVHAVTAAAAEVAVLSAGAVHLVSRTAAVVTLCVVLWPAVGAADALDELKAVQDRYLKAWGARDIETIVDIEGGTSAGFGYTTAFPRQWQDKDAFRRAIEQYFDILDFIRITPQTAEFRVVGNTGLVWGHYAQTTKQKSGVVRTVYLRFAHTYVQIDGKWALLLYHRSLLPNEDVP